MRRTLRYIRKIVGLPNAGGTADEQLVERFVAQRDEAAFRDLVERHGPMVLGVCRRVLNDWHEAEDAFQATFLVLARKAGAIARPERLANWLYGVAHRVALKARAQAARSRVQIGEVPEMPAPESVSDVEQREFQAMLDEEVSRLPQKYRAPVVMCYLEGKTNDEAAQELGWPRGTVATRLARARELLRSRLARRGLALSSAVTATLLSQTKATAAVSNSMLISTSHAGGLFAQGHATAAGISPKVIALADGVLRHMIAMKLTISAAVLFVIGVIGLATGELFRDTPEVEYVMPEMPQARAGVAANLSDVDRTIHKEPDYKTRPKYCLLVFETDASHRVWLVLDDNVLYVDRNSNGDLTEEGERVEVPAFKASGHPAHARERSVLAGTLQVGGLTHTDLTVSQSEYRQTVDTSVTDPANWQQYLDSVRHQVPDGITFLISIKLDPRCYGLQGSNVLHSAWLDKNGHLAFADSPKDAPIVHFGGPLTTRLHPQATLRRGKSPESLTVYVGTPGLGPGTFVTMCHDLVPEDAFPAAQIQFLPKQPGEPVLTKTYVIKERC